MADVLGQIVKAESKSQTQLEKQTKLLEKIYDVEIARLKIDKRNTQKDKRKAADRTPSAAFARKNAAGEKKGESALSKLGKVLSKGGGALLKGVLALVSAIGGLSLLGKAGGILSLLGKGGAGLLGLLGKGGKGILGLLGKGGKGILGMLGKGVKGGGILGGIFQGITEYFKSGSFMNALFAGGGGGAGALAGGALGSLLGPIGTAVGAALGSWIGSELGGILKDQLDKHPWLDDIFKSIDEEFNKIVDATKGLFKEIGSTWNAFTDMVDVLGRSLKRFNKDIISPFFKSVGDFVKGTWKNFEPALNRIGKIIKPIGDALQVLWDKVLKPMLNPAAGLIGAATGGVKNAGNFFKWVADGMRDYADGKQQGGFVGRVPNQGGNGDRFGAMLSPGSVVLNQRASGFMQSGGMVPTMLEQGEHVFGPGSAGAGSALALNSMIPRFQQGGVVPASSGDTGSGFQPKGATDKQGRPVVFSKEAAVAWKRMMTASGGKVSGFDVNSSKRSRGKNNRVGGAANSTHLYGEGVDVQTGSPSWFWMKKNSAKYGWKWNNYMGPQGWHWDFNGSGNRNPGDEDRIAKDIRKDKGGMAGIMASMQQGMGGMAFTELLPKMGGKVGGQIRGFLGSAMQALGPMASVLFGIGGNALQGGFNLVDGLAGVGSTSKPAGGAVPGSNSMGFSQKDWDTYRNTIAGIESGGKYNISGGSGGHYDGRYQLGAAAKTDGARMAGIKDPGHNAMAREAFRRDSDLQEKLFAGFTKANYKYLMKNSKFRNSSKQRQLQILGYAHNQGMGGAENWLQTGKVGSDGFGTKGTKYTDALASAFNTRGMQRGGVSNMKGSSHYSASMVNKSQEQFAQKIAAAASPTIIPVPTGGGGGTQVTKSPGSQTAMPSLPSEDNSIMAMEYKYRITMGASI